ncbi:HAMP domain-containing sensor histidine kinase [Dokdonella soli]|uniref:histidine kinase n=1 Tax=Dokdonella soli TaxID=529810 RepID=A0ABP3TQI8_9GAMM
MEWIGWVCAFAAIGVAIWLWRRLGTAHAHASELLYAKLDAENEADALRAKQVQVMDSARFGAPGSPVGDIAQHLHGSLESVRAGLEDADSQLADYRGRVKQFDAAVQYCLQPVELILGADKATLDQLVHHVEGARRKLFEARAALERHPLHKGAGALAESLGGARALADYAQGLCAFAEPDGGAHATVDVNACLDDALRVLTPRLGERIRIGRDYGEIPKIRAPGAELRQLFLHVLDHAARTIEAQGTLTASTRHNDVNTLQVAIAETGSGSGDETRPIATGALFAEDEAALGLDFAQQLVEELGGTIAVRTTRGQGSTFTLTLPVTVPTPATAHGPMVH